MSRGGVVARQAAPAAVLPYLLHARNIRVRLEDLDALELGDPRLRQAIHLPAFRAASNRRRWLGTARHRGESRDCVSTRSPDRSCVVESRLSRGPDRRALHLISNGGGGGGRRPRRRTAWAAGGRRCRRRRRWRPCGGRRRRCAVAALVASADGVGGRLGRRCGRRRRWSCGWRRRWCAARAERACAHSLQCVFAAARRTPRNAPARTAPLQDRCAGGNWLLQARTWPRMAERRALIEWGRGPYAWRSRSSLESSSGRGRSCVRCVSSVLQKVKNAQTLRREGAAVM